MLGAARPLLLVGGGKMGEALLGGWLRQGRRRAARLVVEPDAGRRSCWPAPTASSSRPIRKLPATPAPGALLLAVKPQTMDAALQAYAARVGPDTLVLSIAAGKPIALFERALGAGLGVVRAMPNTPAAVGRGVTVLCANASATEAQREVAERLMAAVGAVHWIEDEELMHAVTAVSGSGPAYVFHLIEALAAAGVRRACRRSWRWVGARHGGGRRRAGAAVGRDRRAAAGQRDQPGRDHGGGAAGADGGGRPGAAAGAGGGRGGAAIARAGLSGARDRPAPSQPRRMRYGQEDANPTS